MRSLVFAKPPCVMAMPAAVAVARLKSRRRPGPLSESVGLVPICQTGRFSAKTLPAPNSPKTAALEPAARKDIDQVLSEEVPRTILVGRRTDDS
jgi:hypothetical protein